MCKWLSNILFPINFFYTKRNTVTWRKPAGVTNFTAYVYAVPNMTSNFKALYGGVEAEFGSMHTIGFSIPDPAPLDFIFICKNVNKLIVNGDVLIDR